MAGKYDRHVKCNAFADEVQNQLDLYVKEIQETIPDIVKETGKKCVQAIRTNGVAAGIPDKKYLKSWQMKVISQNAWGTYVVVHSPKHYRIAHLLEHGHVKKVRNKVLGTTRAYPHLIYAEQDAETFLENKLKQKLGG